MITSGPLKMASEPSKYSLYVAAVFLHLDVFPHLPSLDALSGVGEGGTEQ